MRPSLVAKDSCVATPTKYGYNTTIIVMFKGGHIATTISLRAFTVGSTIEPFGSIVEPNH
jgi:hypothetical protein